MRRGYASIASSFQIAQIHGTDDSVIRPAANAKRTDAEALTWICFSKDYVVRMRSAIALLVFGFAMNGALAQSSQRTQGNETNTAEYTLQLNVQLVTLSATVLDHHNVPVSGLAEDNFQVYEDGALQKIKIFLHEDVPVSVGIVIDNSGSMAPKRDDVIAAAHEFAQLSNPLDQMFVVNFNDNVRLGLPPGVPFTDRPDALRRAFSGIRAIGETALYDGIALALDHIEQGIRSKKVLILISDGGDNASKHTLAQVIAMARQSAAIIYTIGIFDEQDGDQNPSVLSRFAKETGGEAFFPNSSAELSSICEGIAHDIRNQYTLTYTPDNKVEDGNYRTIVVKASAHGRGHLTVRTRNGYTAPPGSQAGGSIGGRP